MNYDFIFSFLFNPEYSICLTQNIVFFLYLVYSYISQSLFEKLCQSEIQICWLDIKVQNLNFVIQIQSYKNFIIAKPNCSRKEQQQMKKTKSSKSTIVNAQKLTKKDTMKQTEQSYVQQITTQITIADGKSQNVRVAIRVRPMNQTQKSRGDASCLKLQNDGVLQINNKGVYKGYKFNYLLDQNNSQQICYKKCNINQLIDAAIEGYSATIFAYGQTGSGKTYTMAGKQQIFQRQVYKQDQRQGIIPRAIQQLWKKIKQHKSNYSIKASYTQIYNEQIKDLLNLQSGVLHCRWNPTNGFFVQDLIVVDCSTVDDMISVLLEGMRNRKSGSHQMNKDSSRSHSILTLYIITQVKNNPNQASKKYGKISFVDLAGSQRLKQSNSQGEMIKQTGNINKSLFTLGKVIKGLTDKKTKTPYIPYRDSKLTMLLMDSLGGNSKALMIACASPSSLYFDQTLSTLNYAARTMNIRNKPVIQMDQKDQIISEIQSEIQALKKQNVYLREQYSRVNKGLPIKMPQLLMNDMIKTAKLQNGNSGQLPPLQKNSFASKGQHSSGYQGKRSFKAGKNDTDAIITDFQLKFQQIKKQNQTMRKHKDQSQQMYRKLMDTNGSIQNKLDNLEQIFLNKKKNLQQSAQNQIVTSSLLTQNTQLKKKLRQVQKQKIELGFQKFQSNNQAWNLLKRQNSQIQKQIEKLQARQKQLLQQLQIARK